MADPASRASIFITPGQDYVGIAHLLAGIPLRRDGWGRWWLAMAVALALTGLLVVSLGFLFLDGTAIWGNNIPVTWALDIVSYDWWIGIACGGLLVSGLFLLLDAEWRGALNRLGEAMALLAAAAAAVYPIIHLGRPWFFYWNLPYPNSFALWPQFRSPLYWDAVDILSFLGLASGLFYIGLLPDLAHLRDRAWERARADAGGHGILRAQLYGIAALGWRGSAIHWHRWTRTYRILALLGVLVVVTLQLGASVMFAGTVEPGWHDTLLPVTYLTGAVLAGMGMLSVLTVVLRDAFGLQALITDRHLRVLGWMLVCLAAGRLYCELATDFTVLLGGEAVERDALLRRLAGPVAWSFWMFAAGLLAPLLLLLPGLRARPGVLAWVGGAAAAGIWGDHYTLIVASLQHDYLPSAAGGTHITFFEWSTFAGSGGLFLLLLLLFLRMLPLVSIVEARQLAAAPERAAGVLAAETAHSDAPVWGVAAEFATLAGMETALRRFHPPAGVRLDSYTPVPAPAAARLFGLRPHRFSHLALAGGAAGAVAMFAMCVYATAEDYVFDIGGRPRFSWPSFLVPSASFGCLCAGVTAVAALLVLNRLPRLNHPAFNIAGIGRATQDRFFAVAHWDGDNAMSEQAERGFAGLEEAPLAISRVPR